MPQWECGPRDTLISDFQHPDDDHTFLLSEAPSLWPSMKVALRNGYMQCCPSFPGPAFVLVTNQGPLPRLQPFSLSLGAAMESAIFPGQKR